MKNKIFGIIVGILIVISALTALGTNNEIENNKTTLIDNNTCKKFTPGEIIVKLKKDATFSKYSLITLNEKNQVNTIEKIFPNAENTILDNIYLVHVPIVSDILFIVKEYASNPNVEYAESNQIGFPCGIPNDANFNNQWYLHNTGQKFYENISGISDADIDAPEAWDIQTGSSDVIMAFIDSGIDYTHPDLATNIWNNMDENPENSIDDDNNGYIDDTIGWNFCYNNSDVKDDNGHGTLCAGIAGAVSNNGIWGAGIALNCKIMPVKVANESLYFSLKYVTKGLRYAADNGADICSISFHFTSSSNLLKDTINYVYDKGVFLCAAAGNGNHSNESYPAAYDNVIAVAMTDWNDNRATNPLNPNWGSNYGDWVDIAAPGRNIFSTMPTYHVVYNDNGLDQNFDLVSGTSYATPIVTGVAALLLSRDPSITPDEIKTLICDNADPYNSTGYYIGKGRINAYKALKAIKAKPRNIYCDNSSWSKLEISIPQNRVINTPLFLQKLFERFPFFEKINKPILQ